MECGFVFGDVLIDLALDIDCDFGGIPTSRATRARLLSLVLRMILSRQKSSRRNYIYQVVNASLPWLRERASETVPPLCYLYCGTISGVCLDPAERYP